MQLFKNSTCVNGADKGVGAGDGSDVRDLGNVQESSSAGHDVLAKGRVRGDQVGESVLLLGLDQKRGVGLGQGVSEGSVLGNEDLGDASELGNFTNNGLRGIASNKGGDGSAQGRGSSEGVQGRGSDLVVLVLHQQQGGDVSSGGIATGLRLGNEIEW